MKIRADLHIHSCLSPCGDNGMTPQVIVKKALEKGLNMIAICDHNCCDNLKVIIDEAKGTGVAVIPGIEVTSKEEVHLIALFKNVGNTNKLQNFIYENLSGENDEDAFGNQLVVDRKGEIINVNKKFLLGATDISLESLVAKIKTLSGIAIASHIDKEAYSIIGQLGFIPDGLELDALEISPRVSIREARDKFPEYARFPFVTSSDAHFPEDIGKVWTEFELEENGFDSLKKYLNEAKRIVQSLPLDGGTKSSLP